MARSRDRHVEAATKSWCRRLFDRRGGEPRRRLFLMPCGSGAPEAEDAHRSGAPTGRPVSQSRMPNAMARSRSPGVGHDVGRDPERVAADTTCHWMSTARPTARSAARPAALEGGPAERPALGGRPRPGVIRCHRATSSRRRLDERTRAPARRRRPAGHRPAPASAQDGPGRKLPDRGQEHIPQGTKTTYQDYPPASGKHWPVWAPWGIYKEALPRRFVHNLEHGGIVVLYNCATPCPDLVRQLEETYAALPKTSSATSSSSSAPTPGQGPPRAAGLDPDRRTGPLRPGPHPPLGQDLARQAPKTRPTGSDLRSCIRDECRPKKK